MRLCKFLADAGVCSRRAASRLIEAGRVSLDGETANHTIRVLPGAQVCVDGAPISHGAPRQYYLFNKPVGMDCRLLPNDPSSLLDYLQSRFPPQLHLYPAGRLDKDSRGLLLLTNDGELTQQLMHPDYHHEKGYLVTLDKPPLAADIAAIAAGLDYGDGLTRPCRIKHPPTQTEDNTQLRMWLTEGKKRQIRRLWQARGYRVVDLLRESIQSLTLGSLTEGEIRPLTEAELSALKQSLAIKQP
nr:pseudouridine synthase [Shewanella khirikhana]